GLFFDGLDAILAVLRGILWQTMYLAVQKTLTIDLTSKIHSKRGENACAYYLILASVMGPAKVLICSQVLWNFIPFAVVLYLFSATSNSSRPFSRSVERYSLSCA